MYDEAGNPLTSTLADYAVISACELPSFECDLTETPSPYNPLGVKGIGESGTIGAPPAVQNAVVDALSHLGRPPHRHARPTGAGVVSHPGRPAPDQLSHPTRWASRTIWAARPSAPMVTAPP